MGRRNKNIAKNEIYGIFREFIESGQQKVTVSAVIDAAQMNRKTFYNHFANQDELVAWGFRRDLLDVLLAKHDIANLVDSPSDPYGFTELPCYCRTPSSAKKLDQAEYFRELYGVFLSHKDYYRSILRGDFAGPLCHYLVTLLQGLFAEDIDYFLEGRKMPDEAKTFVSVFYAEGVVHNMVDIFMGRVAWGNVEGIAPIDNLAHEDMLHIVEAYQTERSASYFLTRRPR